IFPIAIAYHSEVIVLAAWCELRADFRNFRPDRFTRYHVLPDRFAGQSDALRAEWMKDYAAYL
ncbi:WYL domain-containing protein, partial [Planktotalea sp.]|uniref:WYL domain-containing protein n=1 Tax=Planktotalea sp. TaxID=2029877 RepID=UPI003296AE75